MMKKINRMTIISGLISLTLILASCNSDSGSVQGGSPPVAVEVEKASEAVVEEGLEVIGVLHPRKEVYVRSEIPARVMEIYVHEWEAVKKGQPLARLDTRELHAASRGTEAAFAQVVAQRKRAQREYDRAARLYQKEIIAKRVLENAKTDLETAIAVEDAAGSEVTLSRTRLGKTLIRSPIDGVVSMRSVNVGDIAAGDALFRIVNSDSFDLRINIPSGRIHQVRVGQVVSFTSDAVPGRIYRGTISHMNPAVDEASRTVKVTAQIPNSDHTLRTGLFVKGRIVSGTGEKAITVPRTALASWNMEQMKGELFVVQAGKTIRRTVNLRRIEGGSAQVSSGLTPGEQVVVRGAFLLHDGEAVVTTGRKER